MIEIKKIVWGMSLAGAALTVAYLATSKTRELSRVISKLQKIEPTANEWTIGPALAKCDLLAINCLQNLGVSTAGYQAEINVGAYDGQAVNARLRILTNLEDVLTTRSNPPVRYAQASNGL